MSFDLNRVMLAGRIATAPVRRDVGDSYVCNFSLAMNRKLKDGKEDTCFVDVEVWGKAADFVLNYAASGTPLFVEGSLKMDKWQTQDGQKRQKITVRADYCRFTAPRDQMTATTTTDAVPASAPAAAESEPPF